MRRMDSRSSTGVEGPPPVGRAATPPAGTASTLAPDPRAVPQTGWVGWVVFAGMMLLLLGLFHIIEGLVAIFRDQVFVVAPRGLVVDVDYSTWGWTHVAGGIVAICVGVGVLAARRWARVVAVVVAGASALANVAFLPAYPVWSALMIGIDVLVIWAVVLHGAELERPS
jgi:hypothetical protein